MTNTSKFTIILVIAILIFVFQYKADENRPIKVSHSQGKGVKKQVKAIMKIKNPVVVRKEVSPSQLDGSALKLKQSNQLSFLDIYQKHKLSLDCQHIYVDGFPEKTKEQYVEYFNSHVDDYSNKRQLTATDAQLQAYGDLVDECWELYFQMPEFTDLTLGRIDNNPHLIRNNLNELLLDYKAVTNEEIELKAVLIDDSKLGQVSYEIRILSEGASKISDAERKELRKRIANLEQEIRVMDYTNTQSMDGVDYQNFIVELEDAQQFLAQSTSINDTQLLQKKQIFAELVKAILAKAHTQYASVFYEAFNSLNFTTNINGMLNTGYSINRLKQIQKEYQSFGQIIYENSGFEYPDYFDVIVNPAIHLYLCYLGADCSAQSEIMKNYCFNYRSNYSTVMEEIYHEACGKSLDEFYQIFLNRNIRIDVEVLLIHMVREYAN